MQKLSVFSSRFLSSHDSLRSSSRYSSAWDSHWTLTWNVSVFSFRSSAWTFSYDSFIFSSYDSFAWILSYDSFARILFSDLFQSSSHDSFIKSCLFMKNLYIMFHRLSEKDHTLQNQRQCVFLELTYYLSIKISILILFISSSHFLKWFLQRSKMKLSFWVQ